MTKKSFRKFGLGRMIMTGIHSCRADRCRSMTQNRMPGQAVSAQDFSAALGREERAVIHSGGYSRLTPLPPFAQRVYERHQLQAELRQIVLDPQRIAFESRTP